MPDTYTQIHLHVIFAVRFRRALIHDTWRERLYQYISGIIKQNGHKLLAINGTVDHVHLLIGLRPAQAVSALLQDVKQMSSKWINQLRLTPQHFAWQEGYGAFSHSKSQLPDVIQYINNQQEHHRRHTFLEEYQRILSDLEIGFDERGMFTLPLDD